MKRAYLGLALAALIPVSAQASELSYNFVEAGYIRADALGDSVDGFSLAGSFGFAENWYASASYRQLSEDFATLDETNINLGWRHAISDKADFLAEVGYARLGLDVDGFGDDSADGYRAAIGLRGMMTPQLEGQLKGTWTKIDDLGSDGEFGVQAGATWHFNPTWGLTASYEHYSIVDEDVNLWGLGVRASF